MKGLVAIDPVRNPDEDTAPVWGFRACVLLKILVLFVFYVGDCVSDEVIETVISLLKIIGKEVDKD